MENFNIMAKDYDTKRRIDRASVVSEEIRLHVVDGKIKSALEYGCGTGLVGMNLIKDFKTLFFMDSSINMIEQVKQKLNVLNKPTDTAICCDFIENTPKYIKIDYIFSSLVIHHIKDTENILSRFFNMLHDEGKLLIVDLNTDDGSFHANHSDFNGYNGFEQSTLVKVVEKAGFKNVNSKTFYHGSKVANGNDKPYSLFILDAMK
ncbi:MAG: class I SAM-dependent methyltransferase [Lachnospiraceae bacterium]|nr:class I SAM-dependent methyltransferase [Lachnospiraceae bacterium]